MKKFAIFFFSCLLLLGVTGCSDTESTNEDGKKTRDFTVGETATVNDTKITINSVKKLLSSCVWEYDGKCQSEQKPAGDYYLVIDLTIENTGKEDLSISSIMSFELKAKSGEKGSYALLTKEIKSQLDGTVMSKDTLKGQIAYDVKDAESYTFYYSDTLIDSPIRFLISKDNITE